MDSKGFKIISLVITETGKQVRDTAAESEYVSPDLSDEELEEISEIRKLACEISEPEFSLYTST
jgi:hypothetical protein